MRSRHYRWQRPPGCRPSGGARVPAQRPARVPAQRRWRWPRHVAKTLLGSEDRCPYSCTVGGGGGGGGRDTLRGHRVLRSEMVGAWAAAKKTDAHTGHKVGGAGRAHAHGGKGAAPLARPARLSSGRPGDSRRQRFYFCVQWHWCAQGLSIVPRAPGGHFIGVPRSVPAFPRP